MERPIYTIEPPTWAETAKIPMANYTARLGDRTIGLGHPCLLSFEAGATHSGLESCKRLCTAVAKAGGEAVKFQTTRTEELMTDREVRIEYTTATGKSSESIYDALKRRELSNDEWASLKKHCDDLGLLFISTPTGPNTVDLLANLKAAAIKISKSDINHTVLIEQAANTGIPIILDAREKFQDVERALQICERANNSNVIVMHCPSGYPAESAGLHLSAISVIREIFRVPVAYSDHSVGTAISYAVMGLGVDMLEKTITEDKYADQVEQWMSLEPHELEEFVKTAREIEQAKGDPRIIFNSRVNAVYRRSIVASRDISVGEVLDLDNLTFMRPGTFLSVDQIDAVKGRTAARAIAQGEYLSLDDVE